MQNAYNGYNVVRFRIQILLLRCEYEVNKRFTRSRQLESEGRHISTQMLDTGKQLLISRNAN